MFNYNSDAERAIAVQGDVHRKPKKNSKQQDRFDWQMQSLEQGKQIGLSEVPGLTPPATVALPNWQWSRWKNCQEAWKMLEKYKEEEIEEIWDKINAKQAKVEAVAARKKKLKVDMVDRDTFYNVEFTYQARWKRLIRVVQWKSLNQGMIEKNRNYNKKKIPPRTTGITAYA